MRRALLIRRRRFSGVLFFAAISWVGLGMGFDVKNGLIAKDFSVFFEKKLNEVFVDKEIKLSKIEGGVLNKLTIDGFSISKKTPEGSSNTEPIFSVDRVIVKYNLVHLLRRQFEKFGGIYLISPSLYFTPTQVRGFTLPPGTTSFVNKSVYAANPIKFHILNGSILGLNKKPILTNLTGAVTFYNSTLVFNNLKGTFLGLPVFVNGRIQSPFETPVVKLRLLMKDKYYIARIAFKSTGQNPEGAIAGNIRLFDRFDIYFKGRINIVSGEIIEIKDILVKDLFAINGNVNLAAKSSTFIITPPAGSIKVISNIEEEKGLSSNIKINHVNLFGLDLLSQIDTNTILHKRDSGDEILRGYLKTQALIVNYKPFHEIKTRWVLKKKELIITGFELGDMYRLSGTIKLMPPYNIDLTLAVNNAPLNEWLIFSKYDQPGTLSGSLSGKLKIQGPLKEPVSKGRFNVRNGNIKEIKFNSINFNLEGKGPILAVSDSKIFKEGGFLIMDGEIDLRKFGKRNIFEDINIKTDQRIIVWEGWDISKDIDTSEVRLKKDISEDFKVNFKTHTSRDNIDENEDEKNSELGLDYKIKEDNSINVRMKEDNSAFVGVEHKIKF